MDYLFVYGTLQKESDNDMSKFLSANSKAVGKGYIQGKLYKISWFPGAIVSKNSSEKVYGTLFKLKNISSTLEILDHYEGFYKHNTETSLFKREITTVFLENGALVDAWVYLYNQNITEGKRILSGDFLKDATT